MRKIMVFKILTFDFYLEEKGNYKLLFILMQAHYNEKIKELVNPPPNYDKTIHRLRKKWWIIELKSGNYFLETEKTL